MWGVRHRGGKLQQKLQDMTTEQSTHKEVCPPRLVPFF